MHLAITKSLDSLTCSGADAYTFWHHTLQQRSSSSVFLIPNPQNYSGSSLCISLTLQHCSFVLCPNESLSIKAEIHHSPFTINQECTSFSSSPRHLKAGMNLLNVISSLTCPKRAMNYLHGLLGVHKTILKLKMMMWP